MSGLLTDLPYDLVSCLLVFANHQRLQSGAQVLDGLELSASCGRRSTLTIQYCLKDGLCRLVQGIKRGGLFRGEC